MDGLCDVKGCRGLPLLGWRPLTERIGRKICEQHWHRHQDKQDSFDLFDEFKFRRPAGILKPVTKKNVPRCTCGRERPPGRKLCTACATERERQRKRQYYHNKKSHQVEPVIEESTLRCKQCGDARLPGHSYCLKCSQDRRRRANRERQRQHYKKNVKCVSLT